MEIIKAGTLGGELQQMLTMRRYPLHKPKLILMDEPSLGLALSIIKEIFRIMSQLGMGILLAEQNTAMVPVLSRYEYIH